MNIIMWIFSKFEHLHIEKQAKSNKIAPNSKMIPNIAKHGFCCEYSLKAPKRVSALWNFENIPHWNVVQFKSETICILLFGKKNQKR